MFQIVPESGVTSFGEMRGTAHRLNYVVCSVSSKGAGLSKNGIILGRVCTSLDVLTRELFGSYLHRALCRLIESSYHQSMPGTNKYFLAVTTNALLFAQSRLYTRALVRCA